jgi:glycine hydroxymethyltransferase
VFPANQNIESYDAELWAALAAERQRQEDHVELIASENYASRRVLEAQGSVLTNKYAEGYPGKRYYGGCEHVDVAEQLAIDRVKQLFGAQAANVQPHSGSQANQAVYLALLKPGDTLLGMSLPHGGHLTHGSAVNASGKVYKGVAYGLDPETELIDYQGVARLAEEHRPKLIVAGASAYSRVIDWAAFRAIADSVGAKLLVDMAHYAGLVAAGLYPNPLPHAHAVTSTTHKTLRGPRGGIVLSGAELGPAINSAVFPQLQGGPLMHVIAAKAVAFREAMEPAFRTYQQRVLDNARAMARSLGERGYRVVSGGTDSHMFLVDLRGHPVSGRDAEQALGRAGITVNKNAVPGDPRKPTETSGIRIGSPAVTTRGFGIPEVEELAALIAEVLDAPDNDRVVKSAGERAARLCARFPVYG